MALQLTIFLDIWKNLARRLLDSEDDSTFWQRMNVIFRSRTNVNDKSIFEFIATVIQLIQPAGRSPQ